MRPADASREHLREWATAFDIGWIDAQIHAPTTLAQQPLAEDSIRLTAEHGGDGAIVATDGDVPRGPWLAGGSVTRGGLLGPTKLADRLRMSCLVRNVRIREYSRVIDIDVMPGRVKTRTANGFALAKHVGQQLFPDAPSVNR